MPTQGPRVPAPELGQRVRSRAPLPSAAGSAEPADRGAADPEVTAVLRERAAGLATTRQVAAALADRRLLLPLLEVDGSELPVDERDPCAGQGKAMAAPSLLLPNGETTPLAFTSLSALLAWNPTARPLPTTAREMAQRVLRAGGRSLLLDPGTPNSCTLPGLALLRLATGEPWPTLWEDPYLLQAVAAEFASELAAGQLALRPAPPSPPAQLRLYVRPGRAPADPAALLSFVRTRVTTSAALRALCEGEVELVLADA